MRFCIPLGMPSFIELDGVHYPLEHTTLRLEESDWFLSFAHPNGTSLELAGELRDDRMRLDLRALDEVLGALQGFPITTYPGGQNVCEGFLEMRREGDGLVALSAEFTFDWDRYIDPPNVAYVEPRRVRMQFHVVWSTAAS